MYPEQNEEADYAAFERLLRDLLGEVSSRAARRRGNRTRHMYHYILDRQRRPIPVLSPLKWAYWMEANVERVVVGQTTLPSGIWVSTCFLGLNHNVTGSRLQLYETMLKTRHDGSFMRYQWRYSTWERAEAGHLAVVKLFSAETPMEGENNAALNYPRHRVDLHALRSDYATGFEDRTWDYASSRIVAQVERDARPGQARQAYDPDVEADADRRN